MTDNTDVNTKLLARIDDPVKRGSNVTNGGRSKTLLGMKGCVQCPYKWTCHAYDQDNKLGCQLRWDMLVNERKELGDIGQFLFNEATKMKMDLDGYRAKLNAQGESVVEHKEYKMYLSMLLDLSKHLAKIKYGEHKHVTVDHNYNKAPENDFVVINDAAYKTVSDDKKEE